MDKASESVKLTPRVTRSCALKQLKKTENSLNLSPRVLTKKLDEVSDSVKRSQRVTRSNEKNSDVQLVAPSTTIEPSKLKVVKRAEFVKLGIFKENDIVLAKQKYSCPWPARILTIHPKNVLVYFFGDKRTGLVQLSEIYDYTKSFAALRSVILSKRNQAYTTGVKEVELFLKINDANSIFNTI